MEKFLVVTTYAGVMSWVSVHDTQDEAMLHAVDQKDKIEQEECVVIIPILSFYQKL
jgi:hypothetical protein